MTAKLRPRRAEPVGALAQRDELARKRDAAYASYAEHTQKRQEAERAMGQLKRQLDQEEDDDVAGAYELAQQDYARSLAKANVQLDKCKGLEAEIEALYGREFAAFAEEANAVSKTAAVAVNDFVE